MDLNEYISIQDDIIVIIVQIFLNNLFDLLLSEDSCKEMEFGTEVWESGSQGEV